jgi:hypothetical protein
MNNIDGAFVINLKHRTDRLEEFYNQLDKASIPREKIERFEAIYIPTNTCVGCNESHLAVLKLAKERGYKNVLVFEDDFDFLVSGERFEQNLKDFFEVEKSIDWKVVMLSYNLVSKKPSTNEKIQKILGITNDANNASAYLVNGEYLDSLIGFISYGTEMLRSTGYHWLYQNDQVWKTLQKDDKWFYFLERMGKQRPSYSDLSKEYRESD